jgi:hypothetical protein
LGKAPALDQQAEAGVVGQERQAALALGVGPADPVVAALEMIGGGAPAQQRDPLAAKGDDMAKRLADQAGALAMVGFADQGLPPGLGGRVEELDNQFVEDGDVVGMRIESRFWHPPRQSERLPNVPQKD